VRWVNPEAKMFYLKSDFLTTSQVPVLMLEDVVKVKSNCNSCPNGTKRFARDLWEL
jgi:hypothetical protein